MIFIDKRVGRANKVGHFGLKCTYSVSGGHRSMEGLSPPASSIFNGNYGTSEYFVVFHVNILIHKCLNELGTSGGGSKM